MKARHETSLMKKYSGICIGLLLMVTQHIASGQTNSCTGNTVEDSKEKYEIGDFASVKKNLEECVANRGFSNLNELNQARELLALTAIVEDRLDAAKRLIEDIVNSNLSFVSSYRNIVFDTELNKIKRANIGVTVSSVSKKSEDLNTAPATVKIVTHEEIMDRGYRDLIDLLSDLPGFDISKIYATTYANVFQMGFRQENTERTLFMVDGVEENDLWLNWAYISRQFPLSNIKAVEILYGPSSTMYGPRAFVGAINVLTYLPKESPKDHLLPSEDEEDVEKSFYMYGNVQAGILNTQSTDLTLGIRGNKASIQVSGTYYRSDEHDLSSTEFYNYSPADINNLSYSGMNLPFSKFPYPLEEYMAKFKLPAEHPYYTVKKNDQGKITGITITPAGVAQARKLDSIAYASPVNGAPIGYSNATEDYFISAKLTMDNFLLGFRHWKLHEGFGFYQDIDVAGSKNGSVWAPQNTTVYAQYEKTINEKLIISNVSNFAMHRLGKESNRVNFIAFGDPRANLHFANLLNPGELIPIVKNETNLVNVYGTEANIAIDYSLMRNGWRNRYYYYEAQQFRNEARLFYDGSKVKLSSGLDIRNTLTQGDYLVYMDFDTNHPTTQAYRDKQKEISLAREKGIAVGQMEGSNMFSILDVGFFSQATAELGEKFFISAGNRVDYNQIRKSGGFGFAFSPRFSAIYNTKNTTVKFNYSRGLQNVSQWTKYSTGQGRIPNPNLNTETINFVNLEYSGHLNNNELTWDIIPFFHLINNAVASLTFNNDKGVEVKQNINDGDYRSYGVMSGFNYKPKSNKWNIQLNYTYNNPANIRKNFFIQGQIIKLDTLIELGDIARHRVNFSLTKQTKLGMLKNATSIRANYVSQRPIGPGTTQNRNIGVNGTGKIPPYLLVNGNIGFKIETLPFVRLDLTIENILNFNPLDNNNPEYYHPGPREAAGRFNMPVDKNQSYGDALIPYIPQRPRFYSLRLSFSI